MVGIDNPALSSNIFNEFPHDLLPRSLLVSIAFQLLWYLHLLPIAVVVVIIIAFRHHRRNVENVPNHVGPVDSRAATLRG